MALDRGTRARFVSALVLFLVLASGFVLGMAVERRIEGGGLTEGEAQRSGGRGTVAGGRTDPSSPDSAARRRTLVVEQVGLSEGQKAQVDSIVAFYRSRMHDLREEFDEAWLTSYNEVLADTRNALRSVLSSGQRAAYDSLLLEADRRREERRQRDSLDGRKP